MGANDLAHRVTIESEGAAKAWLAQMLNSIAMERLEKFHELLIAENAKQNLISKASEPEIWKRHFADSAQLISFVPRETSVDLNNATWLDLGTGAGLPGLIVAIAMPEMRTVLVESRTRRSDFLNDCVDRLGLTRCRVEARRLEQVDPFPVSMISGRAFAPLGKLLQLSAPFSTRDTLYLLPKGRSAAQELSEQKARVRKVFHVEQSLTNAEAGILVGQGVDI